MYAGDLNMYSMHDSGILAYACCQLDLSGTSNMFHINLEYGCFKTWVTLQFVCTIEAFYHTAFPWEQGYGIMTRCSLRVTDIQVQHAPDSFLPSLVSPAASS